ncbi:cytochrome p450 monooxygenase [Podospora appendiculata]|uniref:Cytochrome p450 monooxygenase n=1 Tax=Podospora appendiculata TaxID=314037 RepID=A0AAE0XAV2_9PEZI|nr:cytochrome p450 monooxygenase [Podospora appendiculata]
MYLPGNGYAVVASLAALLGTVHFASRMIYNIYFHPLAQYPGPLLHRATRLAYVYHLISGKLPLAVYRLHSKYGPVVRIAPDELSFTDPEAWKDIYGNKPGLPSGSEAVELPKSPVFYHSDALPPSLINESRANHTLLRRHLGHGFSERSLRDQEPIIGAYTDLLVRRLREHAVQAVDHPGTTCSKKLNALDMTAWFNWTTFDIIGDLAFGEPFGCLDEAKYDPWVTAINGMLRLSGYLFAIKHLGLQRLLRPLFLLLGRGRREHQKRTLQKLRRRMAGDPDRPDLIQGLLKNKDAWNMSIERLQVNAGTLIVAGSETTATLLCGATYLLLRNPAALKRLTAEVRSAFQTDADITLTAVGNLPYLLACLTESLRRYPPVTLGMPRVAPKGGAIIAGEFVPEGTTVAVWQWPINHDAAHWKDPFDFRPERFLPRDDNSNNDFVHDRLDALQPFLVGPRNCIGRNLAYAEMRLILAKLVFHFDMRLAAAAEEEDDRAGNEKRGNGVQKKTADWIEGQKSDILWRKTPLFVYLVPVAR